MENQQGLAIIPSLFLLLPLFAVFYLPSTFHPHSLSWLFLAVFIAISSFLGIGYWFLSRRTVEIKIRFADVFLFFFIIYIALQYILQTGFLPNFYLTQWLFLFGCYVLWRFAGEWVLQKRDTSALYAVVFLFLMVGCVETLFGFGQLYGFFPSQNSLFPITGHYVNPDHFAGFIASFAPLAFGVYLFREKIGNKMLSNAGLITFILIIALLPATHIRGSWLAVLSGTGFLLYHKYEMGTYFTTIAKTWPRKVLCVVIILGTCLAGGKALYDLKPDSAFGRLLIWKTTAGMIAEKPVLGHGFDQFKVQYNKAQAHYFASGKASEKEKMIAGNVEHAHNEFLQIWAELGLIGLLLFGGTIGNIFFPSKRKKNKPEKRNYKQVLLLSVKASIITILVSALFAFPLHIFPTLINFFFLLALASTLQNVQPLTVLNFSSQKVKIGGVLFLIFWFTLGWFFYQRYEVNKQWEKANQQLTYNHYEAAISGFEKLYPELKKHGTYLFRYGGALTATGKYQAAIPILERATSYYSNPNLYMVLAEAYEESGTYDKALANYRFSWNIMPHKIYPLYRMAKVFQKIGNESALLGLAKQIVNMEEKVPTTAARQIKREMNDIIQGKDSK
jgi:O-antigen ligase